MKRFFCQCGQEVFFDSRYCQACQLAVGYDPNKAMILSLEPGGDNTWVSTLDRTQYHLCDNGRLHGVCNGLIEAENASSTNKLCVACSLNRTIPDLSKEGNLFHWNSIEQAKRRLIYGLLQLGLPLNAPVSAYPMGLAFDFLEDQRSNPNMPEEFVITGHRNGVITLNILEADEVQRAWQKQLNFERYRTVLGHLRHEAGHYYFELLVGDQQNFAAVFGDPQLPYEKALQNYYQNGPLDGWQQSYISAYAGAHPLEDWAECFAHLLHVCDTLETAIARGVLPPVEEPMDVDTLLSSWDRLAVTLNELNRSLGLADAYPFVVAPTIAEKFRYIHGRIRQIV
ncbi:MAG: putative zinc-binding metallopeptidase [Gammaproteobacteria bacterium]|nr:putative zinc-binding metallopeptidase [Gammaproteobacteria bacterium]MDH5802693.1 putative zinc-binding metallopeptidase [Gammaproteobacteria bacterium]